MAGRVTHGTIESNLRASQGMSLLHPLCPGTALCNSNRGVAAEWEWTGMFPAQLLLPRVPSCQSPSSPHSLRIHSMSLEQTGVCQSQFMQRIRDEENMVREGKDLKWNQESPDCSWTYLLQATAESKREFSPHACIPTHVFVSLWVQVVPAVLLPGRLATHSTLVTADLPWPCHPMT